MPRALGTASSRKLLEKKSTAKAPAPSKSTYSEFSSGVLEDTSVLPQMHPFDNTFTADICEVHVGPEESKAVFHVHKAVLVGASPFFKAALTGSFIEAKSNRLSLPSEQPEIFSGILKAIYSGNEDGILKAFAHDPAEQADLVVEGRPVFVELWLSLDGLKLDSMKNALTSFLHRQPLYDFRRYTSLETVVYVYENTIKKSPLRILVVEVLALVITQDLDTLDSFQDCTDKTPDLGMDLAVALARRVHEAEEKLADHGISL